MIGLPWRASSARPLIILVLVRFVLLAGRLLARLHDADLGLVLEPEAALRDDALADLDAGDNLHHLRLAHADLHHLLVRDVLVVDDQDDGLAFGVGQDRRRRNQRRALERRGDDRDVHRLAGVQPLAGIVGLHPDLHRRAVRRPTRG